MFRFTIRDMLWLTVVVALCVAWWREHEQLAALLRRDQLRESMQLIATKYSAGDVTFMELSRAKIELNDAEIAAASTSKDRQNARRRRDKHLQELNEARSRMSH